MTSTPILIALISLRGTIHTIIQWCSMGEILLLSAIQENISSGTHVTHEASSNIIELQTEDDEHNQEVRYEFRAHSLEAPAPTLAALTEQEIASRAMVQPVVWVSVQHITTTLGLNEWLEADVANVYLSHVWYEMLGRSRMRYVN
ncbi:hypothetical protein BDR03DRAFT_987964 [Suillus americanus]|nr:hypothetical protein BDR03DRAFT_987964 [Suillus americanus]